MEKKDSMVQWVYLIGVLLVILGHSHPLGNTYYPSILQEIIKIIYYFHMPLFFFISGYLLERSKIVKNNIFSISDYLKLKIKKLMYPYIFLTIIGIFPKIILSNYTTDKLNINFLSIMKIIFNPRESIWGHLWFIPTLLGIIIITIWSDKIKLKKELIIGVLIFLNFFPITTNWFALRDISINLIYFILGKYLCKFLIVEKNRRLIFEKKYLVFASILAFILLFLNIKILKLVLILNIIYIILGMSYIFGKKIEVPQIIDRNIFKLYLYGWPFQAIVEIILNKVLHLKWFLIFISMFFVGLLGPLILVKVYNNLNIKNKKLDKILGF